jgi:hypothetical protein
MISGPDLAKCLSFIGCHLGPPPPGGYTPHGEFRPTITISRQTGVGSMVIARRLAELLQERAPVRCQWAVFDRNLVTKVLEEHDLPERLACFLSEQHISRVRDVVEDLLGLHPPSEVLLRQVAETVVHLAEMGHVILVGRGAHLVTRQMRNVFHVRLVAPVENRVQVIMARNQLEAEAARQFIHHEDTMRRRYLKDFFKEDPDDMLLYDLVVNTGRMGTEGTAHLVAEALLDWARRTAGEIEARPALAGLA